MRIKIFVAALATMAFSTSGLAQDLFDVADVELSQNDFNYRSAFNASSNEEHLSCLEKSLAENPNDAHVLWRIGNFYDQNLSDPATAKKYLRKAVELSGKDAQVKVSALVELAYIYVAVDGDDDMAIKTAKEAVELCDKMSPKLARGLTWLAFVYVNKTQPDYSAAISCLRKAVEINPFNAYCQQNLCKLLVEVGTPESLKEAEQALNNAQKAGISFDDNIGLSVQERLALKKGDYAHCAELAISALSHFQYLYGAALAHVSMLDSASVHNPVAVRLMLQEKMDAEPLMTKWPDVQAQICTSRKDYDNAIAAYRRAYEINTNSVQRLYNIALAQTQKGDLEGAIATCDDALALDTSFAPIYSLRAEANEKLDRKASVLADYDKAISLDPSDAFYYYRRAWFERYNGMLDEAALDVTTAIQLSSTYAHYYLTRAIILEALGENDMAKDDYQTVIDLVNKSLDSYSEVKPDGTKQIKPDSKDAAAQDYTQRAYAHLYLGNQDAAKADMFTAAELDPDKDGAYYNLACLFSLMNQKDKALGYLRQAVDAGYDDDIHILRDTDLDNIRDTEGFKQCVADAKAHHDSAAGTTSHLAKGSDSASNADQPDVVEVPFTRNGGVLYVPCSVNGLPLSYCFDSGASQVCISLSEAQFMLKNGYLDQKDLGDKNYHGDATGRISEGMSINLKSLTFGGLTIHNVKASVMGTLNAPLLLGQTAMQRLGNVHIDYDKGVVRITKRTEAK